MSHQLVRVFQKLNWRAVKVPFRSVRKVADATRTIRVTLSAWAIPRLQNRRANQT
jgi:hypothetical protein